MNSNQIAQQEIMRMVSRNLAHIENATVPQMEYNDRIEQQSNTRRLRETESDQYLQRLQKMRQDPLRESPLEQRSREYRQTINRIQENDRNAFRLFELDRDFTLTQLRKKYIRLAKVCHPDMDEGSEEKFTLLTKYYLYLLDYYHRRNVRDKYHKAETRDVRRGYDTMLKERQTQREDLDNGAKLNLGTGKKFDINAFNTIFNKNKFYDPTHEGYGDWLRQSNEEEAAEAPKMFGKKFNMNVFNSAFEEQRSKQRTAIIPIDEVKSCNDNAIGAGGVSLLEQTDNFSGQVGNIYAADLKQVYSNGLLGVNPEHARREYRNEQEYQRHRDNGMTPLTMEERQRDENRKALFIQQEKTRLQKLAERDAAISDHYMRIQGLLQ